MFMDCLVLNSKREHICSLPRFQLWNKLRKKNKCNMAWGFRFLGSNLIAIIQKLQVKYPISKYLANGIANISLLGVQKLMKTTLLWIFKSFTYTCIAWSQILWRSYWWYVISNILVKRPLSQIESSSGFFLVEHPSSIRYLSFHPTLFLHNGVHLTKQDICEPMPTSYTPTLMWI